MIVRCDTNVFNFCVFLSGERYTGVGDVRRSIRHRLALSNTHILLPHTINRLGSTEPSANLGRATRRVCSVLSLFSLVSSLSLSPSLSLSLSPFSHVTCCAGVWWPCRGRRRSTMLAGVAPRLTSAILLPPRT